MYWEFVETPHFWEILKDFHDNDYSQSMTMDDVFEALKVKLELTTFVEETEEQREKK